MKILFMKNLELRPVSRVGGDFGAAREKSEKTAVELPCDSTVVGCRWRGSERPARHTCAYYWQLHRHNTVSAFDIGRAKLKFLLARY